MAKAKTKRPAAAPPAVPRVSSPLEPQVWTKWTPNTIRGVLAQHQRGDFGYSAELADQMRADDRIGGTLDTLVLSALGLPFSMVAADDSATAKDYAKTTHSWWGTRIPESTLADVLRWVVLMGFCLGELIWEEVWVATSRNIGFYEIRPRLRIHHPQFVRYLYAGTAGEGWYLLTREGFRKVTPGDGQWVLFSLGAERSWMNGAVLGLAIPWFLRKQVRRDMGRRSELDGIGIRKITGPKEGIDGKIVARLIREARNMGNESVVFVPAEYGLDIDSNQTSAQDGFARIMDHCEKSIAIRMLGGNLPTDAKGGTYGLGVVQASAQLDRLEALVTMLAAVSREQIVKPYGRYNVEDWYDEAAPTPRYDATPPEDLKAKGAALLTASQALTTLHALGIDVSEQLKTFGLKARAEGLREPPPPAPTVAPSVDDQKPPPPPDPQPTEEAA